MVGFSAISRALQFDFDLVRTPGEIGCGKAERAGLAMPAAIPRGFSGTVQGPLSHHFIPCMSFFWDEWKPPRVYF